MPHNLSPINAGPNTASLVLQIHPIAAWHSCPLIAILNHLQIPWADNLYDDAFDPCSQPLSKSVHPYYHKPDVSNPCILTALPLSIPNTCILYSIQGEHATDEHCGYSSLNSPSYKLIRFVETKV